MELYHKINSLYKRDMSNNGKFIEGVWATDELDYLQNCPWQFTEKVDGINIRIFWNGKRVWFGGRTERAQLPEHLLAKLQETFTVELMECDFPNQQDELMLFGEGYGHKIQSGGKYLGDKIGFVLFDVKVGTWWLKRDAVDGIAMRLGIQSVPVLADTGTLHDGIKLVKDGFKSSWGDFEAEGLVARPVIDLFTRRGDRVITKIKAVDFR